LEHYRIKRSIASNNYPGRIAAIEAREEQMRRKGKDIFGRKLLTGSTATA